MKSRMNQGWALPAICLGIAALFAVPMAEALEADKSDKSGKNHRASVVGAWRIVVSEGTIFEFPAIWVFHEDGTITERTGNSQPPSLITSGNGVWKRVGKNRYAGMIEGFIDEQRDGVFDRRFRVRVTVDARRNHLAGTATLNFFMLPDNTPMPSPPGAFPFTGTRMRVIRE